MHSLPFDKPGRFFKGNLHTHSTRSDGGLTPAEVTTAYRERGYDFLALTDHFQPETYFRKTADPASFVAVTDTREFRTDDFTTILGAEVHGPGMANGETWHILAAGLPLDFAPWAAGETGLEVAKRAVAAGAFVAIAHPRWNSLSVEDAREAAKIAHAVEVYNQACSSEIDRGDSWYMADLLAQEGFRLSACATDDAHIEFPLYPNTWTDDAFGGWVHVRAEALEQDALVAALKAGQYYSSTGPEIHHVSIEDDTLIVECDPAVQIFATGNGALNQRSRGGSVIQAAFPLARFRKAGFVRVTVVGEKGGRAWTNPIWLDAE
ncbi:MAG TPA: CehA/McbA family metallohydrolase [Thermomicrobiales bacterium]|nr:CehA/McbA family metallohydrolase [Thermomicrobiales bacterium]